MPVLLWPSWLILVKLIHQFIRFLTLLFSLNETTLASSLVPDVVREPDALLDFGVDRLLSLAAAVKVTTFIASTFFWTPFGWS